MFFFSFIYRTGLPDCRRSAFYVHSTSKHKALWADRLIRDDVYFMTTFQGFANQQLIQTKFKSNFCQFIYDSFTLEL